MSATHSETPKKPIRIAVIQLARLGDTIQSLMALRAAKQLYPELEITFVCHENMKAAASRTPWIRSVHAFPTDLFLKPILHKARTPENLVPELAAWVEPLVESPWDFVMNWTYSESSSHLAALLPAKTKLGYSRTYDGVFRTLDGWSHYIQAIVQSDTRQSIHLTDILTTQLLTALQVHVGEPEDPGEATVTSKSFFQLDRSDPISDNWNQPGMKWVAIQLDVNSTWKAQDYARFASQVLRRHDDTAVILIGEREALGVETEFMHALEDEIYDPDIIEERVISKVSQTTFDAWAKIIAGSQWLISSDNAAIHLASVLGTRVLNLSSPRTRYEETGPYGNGHYVIRNANADMAYAVWTYASTEWQHRRELTIQKHFSNLELGAKLGDLEVYRSKIRPSESGGGVYFEPIFQRQVVLADWFSQVLAHCARKWYCGWVPEIGQELTRPELGPELVQSLRKLDEGSFVLDRIYLEASRVAGRLHEKASKLKSEKLMKMSDREALADLGSQLHELEALIDRVGNAQEPMQAFVRLTKILLHNAEGEKISEIAESTSEAYKFLRLGTEMMREWISHTLGLVKPVAVAPEARIISLKDRAKAVERVE